MRRSGRILVGVFLALLVVLLVGPFLVPIPPLVGTVPPRLLADADSRFVEAGHLEVHYKSVGAGEPTLVLLHGFGASLFSWREVIAPLAQHGAVFAYDRPAFGLTSRPMPGEWTGRSPYGIEAQADLLPSLLDAWGKHEAVLVGHSAGGAIALLAAIRYPERVRALILVDPAIYEGGGAPGWAAPLLQTPQMRRLGPFLVRSIATRGEDLLLRAWHDPTRVTPEILQGYRKPLQAENWDRALWELTAATTSLDLSGQLAKVRQPTLVISGDDDRIVPAQNSIRLSRELPTAQLVILPGCGHLPQEECAPRFLSAVANFLELLP